MTSLVAMLGNPALADEPEFWKFGPFSFPAIGGFNYKEGKRPAVYTNARGVAVLISVYWMDGDIPTERIKEVQANALSHSMKVFSDSAKRYGEAIAPFGTRTLPNGNMVGELHVETADASGTGYLLQFCLISPKGQLALVTIEGLGAATVARKQYEEHVFGAIFTG